MGLVCTTERCMRRGPHHVPKECAYRANAPRCPTLGCLVTLPHVAPHACHYTPHSRLAAALQVPSSEPLAYDDLIERVQGLRENREQPEQLRVALDQLQRNFDGTMIRLREALQAAEGMPLLEVALKRMATIVHLEGQVTALRQPPEHVPPKSKAEPLEATVTTVRLDADQVRAWLRDLLG